MMLILATLALYWRVGGHQFIGLDDPSYVYENRHVLSGLSWGTVKWAFTETGLNWHPLTWLSHTLDVRLFGLNPKGHHLVNVLFHAGNVCLLFVMFLRMTGALWRSALAAALFAVHPLHVESVAWVAERKDVLSTFFWLLTLLAYLRYAERPKVFRMLPVVILFSLGLMAKPMLVTLPLVLLLFDYWPLGRVKGQGARGGEGADGGTGYHAGSVAGLVVEKLPLFAVSICSAAVTIFAQKQGGAIASLADVPVRLRLENAVHSYVMYLNKLVWPSDLAIFYPLGKQYPLTLVAGALIIIAVVSAIAVFFRKRAPYLPAGWFFFLITLLPVIGIVQVGDQAMADRYAYVPSIGLFMILLWGVNDLTERLPCRKQVLWGVSLLVLMLLSVSTSQRLTHWRDSEAIFRQALTVAPDYHVTHNLLGLALMEKGNLPDAVKSFAEAARLAPGFAMAYNNIGLAQARSGLHDQALVSFGTAVSLKPDYGDALYNRAVLYERMGRYRECMADLARLLEMKLPESIYSRIGRDEAATLLGRIYSDQGNQRRALYFNAMAATANENNPKVFNNFGIAYSRFGRLKEAVESFDEAIRLDPKYAEAYLNKGLAYAQVARYEDAIRCFDGALALDGAFVAAYFNRGMAFKLSGSAAKAREDFEKACAMGEKRGCAEIR